MSVCVCVSELTTWSRIKNNVTLAGHVPPSRNDDRTGQNERTVAYCVCVCMCLLTRQYHKCGLTLKHVVWIKCMVVLWTICWFGGSWNKNDMVYVQKYRYRKSNWKQWIRLQNMHCIIESLWSRWFHKFMNITIVDSLFFIILSVQLYG